MPVHPDAPASSRQAPALVDELAAQSLRRGNTLRLRARGGSMLPFVRDGDVLEVRPATAAEITLGDVVCYEPPAGGLCLHRVVSRAGRRVVTRGDALTYVETVPAAALLGVATAVERRGRRWSLRTRAARWRSRVIVGAAPAVARLLPLARVLRRATRTLRRRA